MVDAIDDVKRMPRHATGLRKVHAHRLDVRPGETAVGRRGRELRIVGGDDRS